MSQQKFSVAISVYKNDDAKYFYSALESITVYQTATPDEIVLIVDGPVSDEIDNVIDEFSTRYPIFHVIRLEENAGLGNALRLAVESSKNELIARMDSDDISLPNRFEIELEMFAQTPTLDIVGGNISEFIDVEENVVAHRVVPCIDNDIKEYMKKRCPLNHVSVMYKKAAVLKSGGYMDLFWNEDYYLWIRMAECGCVFANTGTILVNVRTGADMYKRRGGKNYFKSEKFLQKYMLNHGMIGKTTYLQNIGKRWIVQCAMPSAMRGWVFKKFARKRKQE